MPGLSEKKRFLNAIEGFLAKTFIAVPQGH